MEPQAVVAIEEFDEVLCGPDEPQFNFSATRIGESQLIDFFVIIQAQTMFSR
jgi:hypothetical protein